MIKVSPTLDNKYLVLEDIEIDNTIHKVPEGYKTDGLTLPRFFWWFIPPFKPKYLECAIIHDYLCDMGVYSLANEVFEDCLNKVLIDTEASMFERFQVKCMNKAVYLAHKYWYKTI
jgi:hypothetical protein